MLTWSVQGDVASLTPGQSCLMNLGGGGGSALNVQLDQTSTLSLTVLGANNLSGTGSGRGNVSANGQPTITVETQGAGNLTRVVN